MFGENRTKVLNIFKYISEMLSKNKINQYKLTFGL